MHDTYAQLQMADDFIKVIGAAIVITLFWIVFRKQPEPQDEQPERPTPTVTKRAEFPPLENDEN